MSNKSISIIVPTLNEADNIAVLVRRIAASFKTSGIIYEIVFVDDHSTDQTIVEIDKLAQLHPLTLHLKRGPRGKAFSLLQGFKVAKYDTLCMIDADLQYPPEAIVPMYELMQANNVDVVLTKRNYAGVSKVRQFITAGFNLIFTRLLFGFNYDTQSGLKLFRKSVAAKANLRPTPWSFDLEFIVRALENKFKILSYTIPFSERLSGEAKVRIVKVAFELAKASLRLRFNSSPRRIKSGYRMNMKLAQQMMVVIIVGLMGAGVASGLFDTKQAQALTSGLTLNSIPSDGASTSIMLTPIIPALTQNTLLQPAQNSTVGLPVPAAQSTANISTDQSAFKDTMISVNRPDRQSLTVNSPSHVVSSNNMNASNPAPRIQTSDTTFALRQSGRPFGYAESTGPVIDRSQSGYVAGLAVIAAAASLFLFISKARKPIW